MNLKKAIIKFNPNWILKNQIDGKSDVVKKTIEAISEAFQFNRSWILNSEFHQCEMLILDDKFPSESEVAMLLNKIFGNIDETTGMVIEYSTLSSDEVKHIVNDKRLRLSQEDIKQLKNELKIDFEDISEETVEHKPGKDENNDEPVVFDDEIDPDSLIGAAPFKKWLSGINSIKGEYLEFAKKTNVIENTVFLFSVDRGNGLSKILKIMGQTLERIGYGKFNKFNNGKRIGDKRIEEIVLKYQENKNYFDSYAELKQIVSNPIIHPSGNSNNIEKMILLISLEEWIDHLYDKRLDQVFRLLQNYKNVIYVFSIPYVENIVAQRVYDRLNDVFNINYMRLASPTMQEYFSYFKNSIKKYGIDVYDDTFDAFLQKIIEEKNDGRFYGFSTVNKIVTELLYNILLQSSSENKKIERFMISKEMIKKVFRLEDSGEHTGLEDLENMVALNAVKTQVKEIVSAAKVQKKLYLKDPKSQKPCLHMMFTGNPGTGKTVVARLIGRILKEEGVLSVGNFLEVSRQDLVGQYIGQTAPKTFDVCRSAYGSVLFIDEAYLLANDAETYGSEAIGTLISEMENHRDNMVVIFAGYKDKMEKLFEINSGLRDRIPYIVDFPNYSRSELEDIFFKHIPSSVKYDEEFKNAAHTFFETLSDEIVKDEKFSNGRFVRNLIEKILSKASLRLDVSGNEISELNLTAMDFKVAINDNNLDKLNERKRIGF